MTRRGEGGRKAKAGGEGGREAKAGGEGPSARGGGRPGEGGREREEARREREEAGESVFRKTGVSGELTTGIVVRTVRERCGHSCW